MTNYEQVRNVNKPAAATQKQQQPSRRTDPVLTRQQHPAAIIQRATAAPESLTTADVLQLQRTIGNRAVGQLLSGIGAGRHEPTTHRSLIQAKLTINPPGDAYEQEADRVAGQVVDRINQPAGLGQAVQRQPPPEEEELLQGKTIQRQPEEEEEELLQGKMIDTIQRQEVRRHEAITTDRKTQHDISLLPIPVQQMIQMQETSFPDDAEEKLKEEKQIQRKGKTFSVVTPALEHRLDVLAGSGQALSETVQTRMEESFGASFDRVRIHTGGEAAQISRSLNAEAFTYGNDIYFGTNRYAPTTKSGIGLLAHELTHTLQQTGIHRKVIQRRGGAVVGSLSINTNVINGGLIAGHAWLAYTPTGGAMTTYGTWGNRNPIGLHNNIELGYVASATRTTNLDAADHVALMNFAAANNRWGYINNCSSFAARGWRAVTGERLSHKTLGIPNPSSLGAGIVAANGGVNGVLLNAPIIAGPASSSGSSSSSL